LVRWDSPLVLATAGTLAIHVILVVFSDAMVVLHPLHPEPPPPKVELFDIEMPPPPPPPPLEAPLPKTAPIETAKPTVMQARATVQKVSAVVPAPPIEPVPALANPSAGGEAVMTLDNVAPGAVGVPVGLGKRSITTGHGCIGGGTGSGTGTGSGAGEAPVSVATIKTRALPKGDFGYYNLGHDYPAEAKQLGIEGDIRVRLVVDDHGKVVGKALLNHLGHGLDELALARAAAFEFTPAVDTQDRPVTSVVVWTFHMTLPK
jgi:protein TonB